MPHIVGLASPAPKRVALLPRPQVMRSNGKFYRLVERPVAYRTESAGVAAQIAGKGGGRTVFVRDKNSSYVGRSFKPLRLVTEKNVVEYVLSSSKVEDDNIEWVEVVEPNKQIDLTPQFVECFKPLKGLITSEADLKGPLYDTQTTKCLLLPQTQHSNGNLFRLTQSDYEVNAPAPGSLLTGQELLDALE